MIIHRRIQVCNSEKLGISIYLRALNYQIYVHYTSLNIYFLVILREKKLKNTSRVSDPNRPPPPPPFFQC